MTSKNAKSATVNPELDELFAGIADEPGAKAAGKGAAPKPSTKAEQDALAELEELENLGVQSPTERPHTPRSLASASAAGKAATAKRTTATPPPPPSASARSSEEKASNARRSGDSNRSFHTSFTPSASSTELQDTEKKAPAATAPAQQSSGGGWWGGLLATASAAVKTAEAAVKEIQQNEEAKRWAEQVKGNVGALRGLGTDLTSRALPTFTTILHTLAPPISSHEKLQIHITHDFIGYPSLDPLIYSTFSRVMAQVEGGDLLVIQRGHEAAARRSSAEVGYTGGSSGWSDGPWWRQANDHRDIGSVKGLTEGTKLVRASAEAYAHEYFAAHGGIELAAQRATEDLSESNPVRSSDIFLAVQAISHETAVDLFQGAPQDHSGDSVAEKEEKPDVVVSFAIYLYDPVHSITFSTLSQPIPEQWIKWLDAPSPITPASPTSPSAQKTSFFGRSNDDETYANPQLPEEIAEIIESGGVDPREWVSEWVEETITLGVGVVAQRYVARRMGVGEGGMKGKARAEEVVGDGGGEAARAGVF